MENKVARRERMKKHLKMMQITSSVTDGRWNREESKESVKGMANQTDVSQQQGVNHVIVEEEQKNEQSRGETQEGFNQFALIHKEYIKSRQGFMPQEFSTIMNSNPANSNSVYSDDKNTKSFEALTVDPTPVANKIQCASIEKVNLIKASAKNKDIETFSKVSSKGRKQSNTNVSNGESLIQ